MNVSRQGYYKHMRKLEARLDNDEQILSQVCKIRNLLNYPGVKKLHVMVNNSLAGTGVKISRDRLTELLRQRDMLNNKKTKFCRTSISERGAVPFPNLIKNLAINRTNQVWVSDITYISILQGFCYLSLITDVYSRKIVGFNLSRRMNAEDVLIAMEKACSDFNPGQGLIHHSDKGSQYGSKLYTSFLMERGIVSSMTGAGRCFDNPIAERVNGILKQEFGLGKVIRDFGTALKLVKDAIHLYNSYRLHNSLGLQTPDSVYFREEADDAA